MSTRVDIRGSLEFGWRTFRDNLLFFIVLMLIIGVPAAIMNVMVEGLPWISVSAMFLRGVNWLWRVLALMAVVLICLSFRDRGSFDFRRTEQYYPLLVPYLLGSLLFSAIMLVGMILLVAPGVWFAVKYQFMPYLIIDKGMEPIEALKAAGEITKGFWLDLFLLLLCIAGINFLGAIAFGLGLLLTIPVTFLAHAWVYRSFVPAEE
ncbi:MAG: hypothetical protein STSR0007_03140 [Thermovirga sp.]